MARQDNPFPADAVATTSLAGLPDYPTSYSLRAEEKIDNYLEDFDQQGKTASLILGVRGRYGSGKTHMVLHAAQYLTNQSSALPAHGTEGAAPAHRPIPSKTVYSKANIPDLYDIYKNLILGNLKHADLKQLIAQHYQKLLDERSASSQPAGGRETSLMVTAQVVRERSGDDPEYILGLLRKDLLPVADLPLEFSNQLRQTEPSAREDFFKAYSKLDNVEFGGLADRWIRGSELNDTEIRQLGVSVRRLEPKLAREALRFLLNAYRRAGVAFLFAIDEFERFRLSSEKGSPEGPSAQDREAIREVLKDLAEIFSDCGQILIVSGTVQAWTALPEDVRRARFIPEETIDVRLEPDEARGLLQEYCRAKRRSLGSIFQPRALDRLLEQGEYNARKLLQIAHQACKIGELENRPVAEQDIPQAAARAFGDLQRVNEVQDTIRALAREFGLTCQANVVAGGKSHTFAIGDIAKPVAFVEVLRSFFKLEEIEQARVVAAGSVAIVSENPQARVCAVIVGYSSHEVRQELAKTGINVLIYDEDQFTPAFRDFLNQATAPPPAVAPAPPTYNPARFDRFAGEAREELDRLREGFSSLTERQQTEKEAARLERVAPKLEDVLADLELSAQNEEDIGNELKNGAAAGTLSYDRALLERFTSNLKAQRQLIARARRLNGGQARESAFERLLTEYGKFMESLEAAAVPTVDPRNLANEWQENYFDRRALLREIRQFQNVRKRITEVSHAFSFLAPMLWLSASMRAMLAAGILLVLINFVSVTISWFDQKAANRAFVQALNAIEYPESTPQSSAGTSPSDPEQKRDNTYNRIMKALNDFEIASPSKSPAAEAVRRDLASLNTYTYNAPPVPTLDAQMKFIDTTRRYLSSMTLLLFAISSLLDPVVYISLIAASCLITVPVMLLFRIHQEERVRI